jgi:hypothetical protein
MKKQKNTSKIGVNNGKKRIFYRIGICIFCTWNNSYTKSYTSTKTRQLYKAIKVYSPYKFEKSLGGLTIINTKTGDKEKPDAADTLYRMDELEQKWGKKHLRLSNNTLIIVGDNNQTLTEIFLQDDKEKSWVKKFYGI